MKSRKVVEKVCRAAGGESALARALGIKVQSIQQWQQVPSKRVLDCERITAVSRYEQRPDIYGKAGA